MFNVGDKVMINSIGEIGTVLRADEAEPHYLIKPDDPRYNLCVYRESELEEIENHIPRID